MQPESNYLMLIRHTLSIASYRFRLIDSRTNSIDLPTVLSIVLIFILTCGLSTCSYIQTPMLLWLVLYAEKINFSNPMYYTFSQNAWDATFWLVYNTMGLEIYQVRCIVTHPN